MKCVHHKQGGFLIGSRSQNPLPAGGMAIALDRSAVPRTGTAFENRRSLFIESNRLGSKMIDSI